MRRGRRQARYLRRCTVIVVVARSVLAPVFRRVTLRRQRPDSGYPCRLDRSIGDSDYVLSRTQTITVPQANGLAIGLVIVGVVGLGIAWALRASWLARLGS